MWEFLAKALSALPSAASSDLALAAYALTIVAYALTVWRVSRNKNLLKNLKSLPEKDRLSALEIEMGGVRLATGISPEQWIASRIHRYYFMSFFIGCIVILIVFGIAIWRSSGNLDVFVDLYKKSALTDSIEVPPNPDQTNPKLSPTIGVAEADELNFVIPKQSAPGAKFDTFTEERNAERREKALEYQYEKTKNKIVIEPHLEYADKQRRGEVIRGFSWLGSPFEWDFPILSVKLVNNTDKSILLTEAIFKLTKAKSIIGPSSSSPAQPTKVLLYSVMKDGAIYMMSLQSLKYGNTKNVTRVLINLSYFRNWSTMTATTGILVSSPSQNMSLKTWSIKQKSAIAI